MPQRVVVVGAGFGGLNAVKAFRGCPDVEVTVVERNNHHCFQALLYQVASAGLNASEIASPVRTIFRHQPNVSVVMGSLTGVDYAERVIEVDGGRLRLPYDYLVLAVGVRAGYFGHADWGLYALPLKGLADGLKIRERVLLAFERAETEEDPAVRERLTSLVVVGGGPTGVEMSGAFAELCRHVLRWDFRRVRPERARVILIEGGPRLLPFLPERLSHKARQHLERLGVEVLVAERVKDIRAGRILTDQREIATENVVWAAGVEPQEVTPGLGTRDRQGRLLVGEDLRLQGQEHVYCIGDMASFQQDGAPLPGLAPVAIQEGRHAAANILRQIRGEGTTAFHFHDPVTVATIGRSAAVARVGGVELSGLPAWLVWLFTHLLRIVDFQNRLLVLARWTWAYFAWKWGVRLIIGVERTPPRS
ncbi:MAG: NAD(P)/FAD-dependent oxidoreductase [Armatimonadetes bacterium]|nr:NAD(P)/FAD-dependent oxidoreductase [Armatimonadota bacterium]